MSEAMMTVCRFEFFIVVFFIDRDGERESVSATFKVCPAISPVIEAAVSPAIEPILARVI